MDLGTRRGLLGAGLFLAVAAALAVLALGGAAQAAYPERNITLVVCFPAGGGSDLAARLINNELGEALGKPVIVENRTGAGGNVGINAVARSTPDGHTLLLCSSAFVVNSSLYAHANYDPFKDFVPVMAIGASPNMIVTPAKSPYATFGEFVAKAKAEPNKLNWTTPGMGTTPYLGGELLKRRLGLDMVHVPFTGAGPATNAAVAGQVDVYLANISSVIELVRGGQLRGLAVTAKKRWPSLPDVPTLEELGVTDADTDSFQGIWAPAGTPQPVVDRLVKELGAILARPEIQQKFENVGLPVVAEAPDAFRKRMEREVPMYKDIIDAAGLKVK